MTPRGGTSPTASRRTDGGDAARTAHDLLRRCPVPVLRVHLADGQIVGASGAAQRLLGGAKWRSEPLIGYDAFALHCDPAAVHASLKQVRDGQIDGYHARRRLRAVGAVGASELDADVWVSVSPDEPGREYATAVVLPLRDGPRNGLQERPRAEPHEPATRPLESVAVVGLVDDAWCVTQVGLGLDTLLGYQAADVVGTPAVALVHRADVARLVAASAAAMAGPRQVVLPVRLRRAGGTWVVCGLRVTPLAGGTPAAFAFVVSSGTDAALPQPERLAYISGRLRTIALELDLAALPAAVPGGSARMAPLTQREAEIVARMLDGERVPGIAQSLFVAQSTVRNHLSSSFRKLGVHSQAELLTRFRGPSSTTDLALRERSSDQSTAAVRQSPG